MLTNIQLEDLCERMDIPLERICFKDQLKDQKLVYNRSYIINMEDAMSEDGDRNDGSHWVALQVNKTKNGAIFPMYMDSYGSPPPTDVTEFVGKFVPYNTKDIQSMMADFCGWACCAFLYYINTYPDRTKNLNVDSAHFLEMFDDLNTSCDFKKNEYILKLFFQSTDKENRKPIDVGLDPNNISKDNGAIHIPTHLGKKL